MIASLVDGQLRIDGVRLNARAILPADVDGKVAVSGSELSVRDEVMSRMVPPLAPLSKFFLLQWPSSRKRKCYDMLCVSEKFDLV